MYFLVSQKLLFFIFFIILFGMGQLCIKRVELYIYPLFYLYTVNLLCNSLQSDEIHGLLACVNGVLDN